MKLIDIFNQKIHYLKTEITNLKTAHFKTATSLATMSVDSSISLQLKLYGNPMTYYEMITEKKAIITMTTLDNTEMIGSVYLKGMTPSTINDRRIFCEKLSSTNGQLRFAVYAYSQNESDYNTLSGGGQIFLEYNIECVGTSRFVVNISYEDFYKGW